MIPALSYSNGKTIEMRELKNDVQQIYPPANLFDESDTAIMGTARILDAFLHN